MAVNYRLLLSLEKKPVKRLDGRNSCCQTYSIVRFRDHSRCETRYSEHRSACWRPYQMTSKSLFVHYFHVWEAWEVLKDPKLGIGDSRHLDCCKTVAGLLSVLRPSLPVHFLSVWVVGRRRSWNRTVHSVSRSRPVCC